MPGYFSSADIAQFGRDRADVEARLKRLQDKLLVHKYKSERAQEYARQGLARRLDEMTRTIEFIFSVLPPEQEEIPERDSRIAATMLLQSYFMNVQGCLDNLAWVWVYETNQKGPDGQELKRGWVGLGAEHRYLMRTFSTAFRMHIRRLKSWFDHVAEFRDSTAHRIPLYVPPYIIQEKDSPEYERLSQEAIAAYQRGDKTAYDKHRKDQDDLGKYRPWVSHSPTESSPTCVFHKQILQDFVTIDEITEKLFKEIEQFKPPPRSSRLSLRELAGAITTALKGRFSR